MRIQNGLELHDFLALEGRLIKDLSSQEPSRKGVRFRREGLWGLGQLIGLEVVVQYYTPATPSKNNERRLINRFSVWLTQMHADDRLV